jgi:soluble lytic murein transglycosylase-like protein
MLLCVAVAAVEARAQSPAPSDAPPALPSAAPPALPSAAPPAVPTISERQTESAKKMEAAAARQRAAAQTQSTAVPEGSFFSAGWSGPAMLPPPVAAQLPDCPAMQESDYEPLVRDAAARNQLNPALIKAVIRQESGFRPCAISEKGAMGLMQLMPETVDSMKTPDPFDPAQNVEAGARYLKQMLGRFKGDLRLALAAYNAGPDKVDGAKPAVPEIAETRDYVESIFTALHGEPAEMKTPPTP